MCAILNKSSSLTARCGLSNPLFNFYTVIFYGVLETELRVARQTSGPSQTCELLWYHDCLSCNNYVWPFYLVINYSCPRLYIYRRVYYSCTSQTQGLSRTRLNSHSTKNSLGVQVHTYMASRPFSKSFFTFYRFVRQRLGNPPGQHDQQRSTSGIPTYPEIIEGCPLASQDDDQLQNQVLILDVEGGLLRSQSLFPYFILVAIEAGSFLRGLILLCLYPLLTCLTQEIQSRVMIMVCFLGLRVENVTRVSQATLPKHFLEDIGREGLEVVRGFKRVVGLSRMIPRVMVEDFLKEYIGLEMVVGREVKMVRGRYVGLLEMEGEIKLSLDKLEGAEMIGFGSSSSYFSHSDHQLFTCCKVRCCALT